MEISKQGLIQNNPLDCLKLVYAINKEKLREAFEKLFFQVKDEKDLDIMANIVSKGYDVNGTFRNPNDESMPIVFDCMRMLNAMEFTEEEKEIARNYKNYIA